MPSDPDIADPLKWTMLQGRAYDWAYRTVPQPFTANRVHEWPRGKIVGGSSCLHAMAYVRGHPDDFEPWAQAGGERWSYRGLLPGFVRSEAFTAFDAPARGRNGPLDVYLPDAEVSPVVRAYIAAGRAMGVPTLTDHNSGELAGTSPNSLNIRDGKRLSVADAYLPRGGHGATEPRLAHGPRGRAPGAGWPPGHRRGCRLQWRSHDGLRRQDRSLRRGGVLAACPHAVGHWRSRHAEAGGDPLPCRPARCRPQPAGPSAGARQCLRREKAGAAVPPAALRIADVPAQRRPDPFRGKSRHRARLRRRSLSGRGPECPVLRIRFHDPVRRHPSDESWAHRTGRAGPQRYAGHRPALSRNRARPQGFPEGLEDGARWLAVTRHSTNGATWRFCRDHPCNRTTISTLSSPRQPPRIITPPARAGWARMPTPSSTPTCG